jgi:hypothetical protein
MAKKEIWGKRTNLLEKAGGLLADDEPWKSIFVSVGVFDHDLGALAVNLEVHFRGM